MMKNKRLILLAILTVLLLGAALAGAMALSSAPALAQTTNDDEEADDADGEDAAEGPDVPITGTALDRASAAALEYIGEGHVSGTEVGDEEGYYEIEITRGNGSQVDVHLDKAFNVLSHEDE